VAAAATCSRWFLVRGFYYPEDGGDTFLRNVGSIHKLYKAPYSRRRHSSLCLSDYLTTPFLLNDELRRIRKEEVEVNFDVLSQDLECGIALSV
jgi:hypothetical protein